LNRCSERKKKREGGGRLFSAIDSPGGKKSENPKGKERKKEGGGKKKSSHFGGVNYRPGRDGAKKKLPFGKQKREQRRRRGKQCGHPLVVYADGFQKEWGKKKRREEIKSASC